jgi:hypothetical protein
MAAVWLLMWLAAVLAAGANGWRLAGVAWLALAGINSWLAWLAWRRNSV